MSRISELEKKVQRLLWEVSMLDARVSALETPARPADNKTK
jgi:hypothetical protein